MLVVERMKVGWTLYSKMTVTDEENVALKPNIRLQETKSCYSKKHRGKFSFTSDSGCISGTRKESDVYRAHTVGLEVKDVPNLLWRHAALART